MTTYYVGAHYQVDNGVVTKYYFAGAQRVAMRKNGILYYLLADHLGSTSLTTNTSGAIVSELRYKAWGETRYSSGTTPTSYRYTGQREEAGIGLYFYNARWYDPLIGRFTSADTIVPGGVQGLDRYAYVNNSPVRYTDPSGHKCVGDADECDFPHINYQDNVPLSSDAQDLIKLSEQVGMTPSEIIKLGISHEIAGWASDKDKVNKYAQYLSNRFVWYAKHRCGGMLTYNCYLNFAVATHQTIKKSFVNNYLNNPQSIGQFEQNESLYWSQTYHDAADIVMNGFWTRLDSGYDPDTKLGDRDKPFNTGIIPKEQLNKILNNLTPDQINSYFIVKTSTDNCGGIPSYSLIVSYTGDQLLQDNHITLTSC